MRQSNFIFGALAVAFVIFLTIRGSLPVYMGVLFGNTNSSGSGNTPESEPYASNPRMGRGLKIIGEQIGKLL
jgi:hypothetical protein